MSLSNENNSPISTPAGVYPALHGGSPRKKKHEQLMQYAMEELAGAWGRYTGGWYNASAVPERLKLKDIIKDQGRRLFEMVKEMDNEFGALLTRYNNELELSFFQVGKAHEIDLAPTRPLREGEVILGTIHGHPTRDYPSTTDIYTFLEFWEHVGIILGSKGTVYCFIKTEDTTKPKMSLDEFDKMYVSGENASIMAKDFNCLLYKGRINDDALKLTVGDSDKKESSLEDLLKDVPGETSVIDEVKKVKLN